MYIYKYIGAWLVSTVKRLSGIRTISVAISTVHEVGREQGVRTISVAISTVHEVGREQGVLTISVVFSTVHEVGREQGVLTISVAISTVHEVGREKGILTTQGYVLSQVLLSTKFDGIPTCTAHQNGAQPYKPASAMSVRPNPSVQTSR